MRFFMLFFTFSMNLLAETYIHGFLGQGLPFSDFGFGLSFKEASSFRHRLNLTLGHEEFFGVDEGRYYLAEFKALSSFYSLDIFMPNLPFVITPFLGSGFWQIHHAIYEDTVEGTYSGVVAGHSGIKFSQEWTIFEKWRISWTLFGACLTRFLVKPPGFYPLADRLEQASIFGFLNLQLIYRL